MANFDWTGFLPANNTAPFSQPGNYPTALWNYQYGPPLTDPSMIYGPQPDPTVFGAPFPQALPPPAPFSQPGNYPGGQGQGQTLPPPRPASPFSQPGNYPPAGGQAPYTLQNVQSQNVSGYNNPSGGATGQGANMAQNTPPGIGAPGSSSMQQTVTPFSPGAAPGQPGQNGQAAGAITPENAAAFGSRLGYNPENPGQAMWNTLKQLGLNPGNPGDLFAQFLMDAAPGLGEAYKINNASAGAGSPAVQDFGNQFHSFLQNALSQGSVFGTLNKASQDLTGTVMPLIRQLGSNSNLMQTNPILQSIADTAGQGGGQGLGNILLSLLGPSMSPGAQAGFKTGLGTAQRNAMGAFGQGYQNNTYQGKDLWSYLLGM